MLTGFFNAIIAFIIGRIRLKKILDQCQIEKVTPNVDVFEYKGTLYHKARFIRLEVESIKEFGTSKRQLKHTLDEYESELVTCKHPDLYLALIEAYKQAIQ